MVRDDPTAALHQLGQLLEAGAEIEQRHADGTPVSHGPDGQPDATWPLAPGLIEYEPEPDDDTPVLWLCPLYPHATGPTDDGRIAFDAGLHQMRSLNVERFDLLAEGNVGMQHPNGVYSVVRRCTDPARQQLTAAWAAGPLTT